MRKKVLIPAVAAGLVATTLAVPSAMAQEQKKAPPPKSTATVETCTKVQKELTALARAGRKTAYCSGNPKVTSRERAVASVPSLNPICEQALGLPPNTWPQNRTETCSAYGDDLFAVDVPSGNTVGYMEIRHLSYYATNVEFNSVSLLYYAKITQLIGRGFEDAHIAGAYSCHAATGGCSANPPSAAEQAFNHLGAEWSVSTEYTSEVDVPGEVQHLGGWLDYAIFSAAYPLNRAQYTSVPPHPVQCDFTFTGADGIPAAGPGCTLDDYLPIFEVWRSRYPTFHRHIQEAQSTGLPGNFGAPLTRLLDPDLRDRNRARACPRRYPRPTGHECDEYPFASTKEGANEIKKRIPSARARTHDWCQIRNLPTNFSGPGWSSCMIPEADNAYGGIDLNQFYARNRLIDGDQFYVILFG